MRRQRTLAGPVSCTGVGLHTGSPVKMTLRPAAVDSGFVFECPGGVSLPARVGNVMSTRLATTLGVGAARIATVEHVLAALHGLGVDNARIAVNGPEVPAMDGSAAAFVYLVRSAGVVDQAAAARVLRVRRALEVQQAGRRIRVEPAPTLRVTYAIDFAHPSIGRQSFACAGDDPSHFEREIAGARTFAFLRDVEALRRAGLARGGSLSNTLVLDDAKLLNVDGARFADEFVRHKVLDLFGDLALLGARLQGHVRVECGGHALHLMLVRALLEAFPPAAVGTGRLRGLPRWPWPRPGPAPPSH